MDRPSRSARQTRRSNPSIEEEPQQDQSDPNTRRLSDASNCYESKELSKDSEEMKESKQKQDPVDAKGIRTRLSTGTLVMSGTSTTSSVSVDDKPNSPPRSTDPASSTSRKRKHPEDESDEESSKDSADVDEPLPPKRKKIGRNDGTGQDNKNDYFCWLCHKEGFVVCCELCPRVFHIKCLGRDDEPAKDWICPECESVLKAECAETRSKVLTMVSISTFCSLLRFALDRMRSVGNEAFELPVDQTTFPNYRDYVFNPMSLSVLEKNIKKRAYGSTEAFLADAKWIYHNAYAYNGANSKITTAARSVVKVCKHEMSEIEVCPDCYLQSCTQTDPTWFCEPCRTPHPLVWAKLKGYPYWPAKILREENGNVDVRFFGAHDRSWVPESSCYLLSESYPMAQKKGRAGMDLSLKELTLHIQRWRQKFGSFLYAAPRVVYSKESVSKHFKRMNLSVDGVVASFVQSENSQKQEAKRAASGKTTDSRPAEKQSVVSKTAMAVKSKYSSLSSRKTSSKPGVLATQSVSSAPSKGASVQTNTGVQQRQVIYLKPMPRGVFLLSEQTVEPMPQLKSTSGKMPRPNLPDLKLITRIAEKIKPVSCTSSSDTEVSDSDPPEKQPDKAISNTKSSINQANISGTDSATSKKSTEAPSENSAEKEGEREVSALENSSIQPDKSGVGLVPPPEGSKDASPHPNKTISPSNGQPDSTLNMESLEPALTKRDERLSKSISTDICSDASNTQTSLQDNLTPSVALNADPKLATGTTSKAGREQQTLEMDSGDFVEKSTRTESGEKPAQSDNRSPVRKPAAADCANSDKQFSNDAERTLGPTSASTVGNLEKSEFSAKAEKSSGPESKDQSCVADREDLCAELSQREKTAKTSDRQSSSIASDTVNQSSSRPEDGYFDSDKTAVDSLSGDKETRCVDQIDSVNNALGVVKSHFVNEGSGTGVSSNVEQNNNADTTNNSELNKLQEKNSGSPSPSIPDTHTVRSKSASPVSKLHSSEQSLGGPAQREGIPDEKRTETAISPTSPASPRTPGPAAEPEVASPLGVGPAGDQVVAGDKPSPRSTYREGLQKTIDSCKAKLGLKSALFENNDDDDAFMLGMGEDGEEDLDSDALLMDIDEDDEEGDVTDSASVKNTVEPCVAAKDAVPTSSGIEAIESTTQSSSVSSPPASSPSPLPALSTGITKTVSPQPSLVPDSDDTAQTCRQRVVVASAPSIELKIAQSESGTQDSAVHMDTALENVSHKSSESPSLSTLGLQLANVPAKENENSEVCELASATASETVECGKSEKGIDIAPVLLDSHVVRGNESSKDLTLSRQPEQIEKDRVQSNAQSSDEREQGSASETIEEVKSRTDPDTAPVLCESPVTRKGESSENFTPSGQPKQIEKESVLSNAEKSDNAVQGSAKSVIATATTKEQGTTSEGSKSSVNTADIHRESGSKDKANNVVTEEPVITSTEPPPIITIDDENSSDDEDNGDNGADDGSDGGSGDEADRVSLDMEVTCEDDVREDDPVESDSDNESNAQPSDQSSAVSPNFSQSHPNIDEVPRGKFSMARTLLRPENNQHTSISPAIVLPTSSNSTNSMSSPTSISFTPITTATATSISPAAPLVSTSFSATSNGGPRVSTVGCAAETSPTFSRLLPTGLTNVVPSVSCQILSTSVSPSVSSPLLTTVPLASSEVANKSGSSACKQVFEPRVEIDRAGEEEMEVQEVNGGSVSSASAPSPSPSALGSIASTVSAASKDSDSQLRRLVNYCRSRGDGHKVTTASRVSVLSDPVTATASSASLLADPITMAASPAPVLADLVLSDVRSGTHTPEAPLSERLKPVLQRGLKKIMDAINPCFEELSNEIQQASNQSSGDKDIDEASVLAVLEEQKKIYSEKLKDVWKLMYTSHKESQKNYSKQKEILEEKLRAEFDQVLKKRIEETKKHQWCAECLKEAVYYCCWNTSYCSYQCQQKHWPAHMPKCMQAASSGAPQSTSTVSTLGTSTSIIGGSNSNICSSSNSSVVITRGVNAAGPWSSNDVSQSKTSQAKKTTAAKTTPLFDMQAPQENLMQSYGPRFPYSPYDTTPRFAPKRVNADSSALQLPPQTSTISYAPNQPMHFQYLPQAGGSRPVILASTPGTIYPKQSPLFQPSTSMFPLIQQPQVHTVGGGGHQTAGQVQQYISQNPSFSSFALTRQARPM